MCVCTRSVVSDSLQPHGLIHDIKEERKTRGRRVMRFLAPALGYMKARLDNRVVQYKLWGR